MTANTTIGNYLARVTHQYFGESKQKATLKFVLGIQIFQDLSNPGIACVQFEREVCWWITEKSLRFVMQDLCALGYEGQTLSGVDPDTAGFHDFRAQEVEVCCFYEKGPDGRLWERWKLLARYVNLSDKSKLREFDRILTGNTNGTNADRRGPCS